MKGVNDMASSAEQRVLSAEDRAAFQAAVSPYSDDLVALDTGYQGELAEAYHEQVERGD